MHNVILYVVRYDEIFRKCIWQTRCSVFFFVCCLIFQSAKYMITRSLLYLADSCDTTHGLYSLISSVHFYRASERKNPKMGWWSNRYTIFASIDFIIVKLCSQSQCNEWYFNTSKSICRGYAFLSDTLKKCIFALKIYLLQLILRNKIDIVHTSMKIVLFRSREKKSITSDRN